jgi:V/A-type H+-transporting ATPase subunit D
MTTATRSNVVRTQRRLEQVQRGAALLRRRRETLVAKLFERVAPTVDSRRAIEALARDAYRALLDVLAACGPDAVRPLGWPERELRVDLEPLEAWGIHGVRMTRHAPVARSVAARGVAVGPGDAPNLAAAEAFERLLERLVGSAPEEEFLRRLAEALAHTTRLVNTLEQRVVTGLEADLRGMRRTLEEREREEHLRLAHVAASRGRT